MAVLLVGCGGVLSARAFAQAPANSNAPQNNSTAPADKPKNSPEANPFPDDTNVPVLPSANSPGTAASAPDGPGEEPKTGDETPRLAFTARLDVAAVSVLGRGVKRE